MSKKNNLLDVIVMLFFFIGGFLVCSVSGFTIYAPEKIVIQEKPQQNFNVSSFLIQKDTPGNWILQNKIKVYDDKIVINIPNAQWSEFTNTHSMEPVFGSNANGLEIKPESENQINIGDIVSYNDGERIIVHRVIEKRTDNLGTYFILKGDNNPLKDPEKVRFNQIQGVVFGIIY